MQTGDKVRCLTGGDTGVIVSFGQRNGLGDANAIWVYWPSTDNILASYPGEIEVIESAGGEV